MLKIIINKQSNGHNMNVSTHTTSVARSLITNSTKLEGTKLNANNVKTHTEVSIALLLLYKYNTIQYNEICCITKTIYDNKL